ncbi:MAG: cupin domain-containing protein [Candidatus Promineifilaceae bacterium]|nr:cupin domain-containing protein [Candidatus Promineifilaceae bacterium]
MKIIKVDPANWQHEPGYRRNILLTGADLNSSGARVQIVAITPGETVASHYHEETYEVYYVLSGQCRLTVNEETLDLLPGMLLLMEPGDAHTLTNNGRHIFEVLVFKTNAGAEDTFWLAQ